MKATAAFTSFINMQCGAERVQRVSAYCFPATVGRDWLADFSHPLLLARSAPRAVHTRGDKGDVDADA